jgi:hypothetical protein
MRTELLALPVPEPPRGPRTPPEVELPPVLPAEPLGGARGRQTRISALQAASRIYTSEGRYGAAGSTVVGMAKVFEAYIIGGR